MPNGRKTVKFLERSHSILSEKWIQHAESIRTLGVCYSEGLGVEQSFEKAFELYQKAAELGLVDAYFDLGVCYRRGEGVEMNLEKAKECYQKAIDAGNDNALVNMGGV